MILRRFSYYKDYKRKGTKQKNGRSNASPRISNVNETLLADNL